MSRSMMIIAQCDSCGITGDEELFAMDQVLDIPGVTKKPKMLDLCTENVPDGKDCKLTFDEAMAPWVEMAHNADVASRMDTVKPAKKATAAAPVKQPVNRQETQRQRLADGTGWPCDVQGCDTGPDGGPFVAGSATGIGTHKARVHGIPGASRKGSRKG